MPEALIQSPNVYITSVPIEIWSLCFGTRQSQYKTTREHIEERKSGILDTSPPSLPRESLRALSATCRLFKEICQPALFNFLYMSSIPFPQNSDSDEEEWTVRGRVGARGPKMTDEQWESCIQTARRNQRRLLWFLDGKEKFASYIQIFLIDMLKEEILQWVTRDDIDDDDVESGMDAEDVDISPVQSPGVLKRRFSEAYADMINAFKTTIGLFTSLRMIHVQYLNMDEDIARALAQLKGLKVLRMYDVRFSCRKLTSDRAAEVADRTGCGYSTDLTSSTVVKSDNMPSPLLITVEELSITNSDSRLSLDPTNYHSIQPLELFSMEKLETLEIWTEEYVVPLLVHFARLPLQNPDFKSSLVDLELPFNSHIISSFFSFLESGCCSNLRSLFINNTIAGYFYPSYPQLSPSAIPLLKSFKGPASLGAVLVPGRPVTTVGIQDAWSSYVHSNTDVADLHVLVKKITDVIPSSIISYLKKSTAPVGTSGSSGSGVKSISLPYLSTHPEVFHVLKDEFPELRKLELKFNLVEEDLDWEGEDWEDWLNDQMRAQDSDDDDDGATAATLEQFDLSHWEEDWVVEIDENGVPKREPRTIKGMFDHLCTQNILLPPHLTHLTILHLWPETINTSFNLLFRSFLSFREQYAVIRKLSSYYPELKKVTIGRKRVQWVKVKVAKNTGEGYSRLNFNLRNRDGADSGGWDWRPVHSYDLYVAMKTGKLKRTMNVESSASSP